MDNILAELEALTKEFITSDRLPETEEVERFMSRREELMQSIRDQKIDGNQRLTYLEKVQSILAMDADVLRILEIIKADAYRQLMKIETGKKQKSSYENMDKSETSYFFDTRN